jgi:hypothetical protein
VTGFAHPEREPAPAPRRPTAHQPARPSEGEDVEWLQAGNRAVADVLGSRGSDPRRELIEHQREYDRRLAERYSPTALAFATDYAVRHREDFAAGLYEQVRAARRLSLDSWQRSVPAPRPPAPSAHVLATALELMDQELGSDLWTILDSEPVRSEYAALGAAAAGGDATITAMLADGYSDGRFWLQPAFHFDRRMWTASDYPELSAGVVAAGWPDPLSAFAAAVRLHSGDQATRQADAFRTGPYSAVGQTCGLFLLQALARVLPTRPEGLHPSLTTAYLRLLDDNAVWEKSPKYPDLHLPGVMLEEDMTFARDYYGRLHSTDPRDGTLLARPVGTDGLGDWRAPALGFAEFAATATGVTDQQLAQLGPISVGYAQLTIGFRFTVDSPYTRAVFGRGRTEIRFTRDPHGTLRLEDGLDEDALEWLASYHSGISRELTDAERAQFAPLGAQKLFTAVRGKPIMTVRAPGRHG